MSNVRFRRVAPFALLLVFVGTLLAQDRARELLEAVIDWVRELGMAGALIYGALYVLATVALVPGALLTLGAGALYGPLWGAVLVTFCSLAGASLSYALARSWWRPWVLRKLQGRTTLLALDRRMADEGWKIVLLLRLSPLVPFSLLNYALGVTRLSYRDYLTASALGMLPAIVLYTYLGSALASLGQSSAVHETVLSLDSIAFWMGLAATLAVTIVITRWARRALRELEVASPATPIDSTLAEP
jgi:uncharacterized membrane protein YdjX (TVP38/TMEM64 family)